jgi:hypothetical protein
VNHGKTYHTWRDISAKELSEALAPAAAPVPSGPPSNWLLDELSNPLLDETGDPLKDNT